ncbi:MAG: hypothetical protein N3D11_03840 [Candidatus Sumerlaeia bacterium]|nr:hypothetical protein [Candidatus Sumerlaeia bacterium]
MEEIGLQFEIPQDLLIPAVRRHVSVEGRRLIEESPLRRGMSLFRSAAPPPQPARAYAPQRSADLAALLETYFDGYFCRARRRALIIGPTVGRWTGILYDEKALDSRLLRAISADLGCRAVGFCFVETAEAAEYSYMELRAGRIAEVFCSFLTDGTGCSFWSAYRQARPPEGALIANGFLKGRYQFIPGFYDLPFLRGQKAEFACYRYSAFPDRYAEAGNYPLSAFRYFVFQCSKPERA